MSIPFREFYESIDELKSETNNTIHHYDNSTWYGYAKEHFDIHVWAEFMQCNKTYFAKLAEISEILHHINSLVE